MTTNNKKHKSVIQGDINPDHKLIEESAIENKGDKEKSKGFFTVRNIVLLVVGFAVSITLLAVTIVFILDIKWDRLFGAISNGFVYKMGILWFALLIFYFVYSIFSNYATLWLRLRKWGYKIPMWEYWLFAGSNTFLRVVTPVLFSDPYTLFWLKTKGVSTSRATSLLFSNTLFWQFVQFAVTFPSFVLVLIYREPLIATPEGISALTLLCIGIVLDVCCIAFMVALNMSKKMHSGLSKIFNWFKKKLHMKYHTKAEIELKYKEKATLKRDFIDSMKDWKTTVIIILVFAINEMVLYFAVNFSLYFVGYVSTDTGVIQAQFDFWSAFNCANVTFTANRINFITPGGSGPLEWLLQTFLLALGNFNFDGAKDVDKTQVVVNNGVLVWRTFGAYLPGLIGLGCFGGLTGVQARRYKHNKHIMAEHE